MNAIPGCFRTLLWGEPRFRYDGERRFRDEAEQFHLVSGEPSASLVALDDSLKALAAFDRRKSQVVELRLFGGLSVEETAEFLKVSRETVMRDWRLAKSWLRRELGKEKLAGS